VQALAAFSADCAGLAENHFVREEPMLSHQDNERLTRVGPGTPMGNLMREYWIPACLPSELEPDGAPMRLLLLGEKLIAFRDTNGKVGILDHLCPHRCASLFFGRNEKAGLRCVYHGWKFDTQGNCLDMPNVPKDQEFSPRIKAKAYPTIEQGGLVWTYMGKRETAPPPPTLECFNLPEGEISLMVHQRECNWLQSLEGDIDTSHFGFLHVGSVEADDVDPDSMHRFSVIDRAPRYHVRDTDWGTMYTAYRPAQPGHLYHRVAHFMFPCFALTPDGTFSDHVQATLNVPMDDTHTLTYNISWARRSQGLRKRKDGSDIPGAGLDMRFLPRTNDWYGRFQLVSRKDNDYEISREKQRTESYSGIESIGRQDQACVESMGEIVDRGGEHLAPSDRMIAMTRRRILQAARDFEATGTLPPTAEAPEICLGARGGAFIARDDVDWLEAYDQNWRERLVPVPIRQAAE
jgi:phenylpropionate dioxygenase-like ring-hydroxylating dioxygenase large terminal subunit